MLLSVTAAELPQELWVFGYASVIWKHGDIPHTESRSVHINGFKRRLWQGSNDHRGTIARPGRVAGIFTPEDFTRMGVDDDDAATLKGAPDPWRVHGMAFRVTPEYREEVVSTLHVRETDYSATLVTLYETCPDGSEAVAVDRALTFFAPPGNPSFLGFATHANIASHVASATGEAGTNSDYVRNLHTALVRMKCPDAHIERVAALL